jgi:hypothetical protein
MAEVIPIFSLPNSFHASATGTLLEDTAAHRKIHFNLTGNHYLQPLIVRDCGSDLPSKL